jgi:hypothetical protein
MQQALEALDAECGGRCNAEYNPCWARTLADKLASAMAEQPSDPWRDAVDEALTLYGMTASADPLESLNRLIAWECSVQLDPKVSSAAAALVESGKRLALAAPQPEPVGWAQLGMLNGKTYLRMVYDRTPYPPPADVARNLNLVPLFAAPQPQPEPVDARKLVNDFARAVAYGEDADRLRTGDALVAALGQAPQPQHLPDNWNEVDHWKDRAEQMREYGAQERAAERERLRVLVEAVRDANAAASGRGDSFHICTEAQRMAWVRLMDVLA